MKLLRTDPPAACTVRTIRASAFRATLLAAALACIAGCGGSAGSASSNNSADFGSGASGGGSVNTGAAQSIYVIQDSSLGVGTILQFPAGVSGSLTPTAAIAPGLPLEQVATDSFGRVYVYTFQDIREYAVGATGNSTPIRIIPANSTTQVAVVEGLSVSPSGEIVVGQASGEIDEFGATQAGSVPPERYILGNTESGGGLSPVVVANQIAIDASEDIYVAPAATGVAKVVVFGPAASGNVAPARTIGSAGASTGFASGVALDSNDNVYTTSYTCTTGGSPVCAGTVSEYLVGQTSTNPARTITGSATQLGQLAGIQVDALGNIYVVSTSSPTGAGATSPTVLMFTPGQSGNSPPSTSFTSSAWTVPDINGSNASIAIH